MLTIERSVCGCDYGGNSWTTRAEAERIAAHLALHPGARLLDLGAGSGWPGLYMSQASGCDVALVDLPLSGLRIAVERAKSDDYPELLVQTGWIIAGHEDITSAYAASCGRQLHADETQKDGLVALIGASEFAERLADWRAKLAAIDDDLLRRGLFVATPGPQ